MNDWCNWIFVMKMSLISYDILLHVYFLNTIFWRIHFKPLILQHGWWNVWDFCVTSLHEWSYLSYFENFFYILDNPPFGFEIKFRLESLLMSHLCVVGQVEIAFSQQSQVKQTCSQIPHSLPFPSALMHDVPDW